MSYKRRGKETIQISKIAEKQYHPDIITGPEGNINLYKYRNTKIKKCFMKQKNVIEIDNKKRKSNNQEISNVRDL